MEHFSIKHEKNQQKYGRWLVAYSYTEEDVMNQGSGICTAAQNLHSILENEQRMRRQKLPLLKTRRIWGDIDIIHIDKIFNN